MPEALPVALRQRIVAAYKRGDLTYLEAAELFGVGAASVSRLLARDRRNGDVAPDAHGGGNPPRIPPDQYDALRALVVDAPDATRQELCDAWKDLHGVIVSVAAMGRTLRDADVTRKKKQFRASEQEREDVVIARQAFVAWLKTVDFSRLIFIDETGCNVKLTPEYGWAIRGERLVDRRPACRGKNLSVVAAIREDRVLCHDKFEGALNGKRWVKFVATTLVPQLYPGDVVIVDNLGVHKNAEAKALIEAEGATLKFLPPYSPDMNPIELCWSFLKHQLRRLRERTIDGLRRGVWRALMRVTGRHLRGWFDESCRNIQLK